MAAVRPATQNTYAEPSPPVRTLGQRGEPRVGHVVEVAALVVPVLHVIARCLPSGGTRGPLDRRRIPEQSGVYHPRHLRTVDGEMAGCDDRLSAGEERPPIYKDARATAGVERVGEP